MLDVDRLNLWCIQFEKREKILIDKYYSFIFLK